MNIFPHLCLCSENIHLQSVRRTLWFSCACLRTRACAQLWAHLIVHAYDHLFFGCKPFADKHFHKGIDLFSGLILPLFHSSGMAAWRGYFGSLNNSKGLADCTWLPYNGPRKLTLQNLLLSAEAPRAAHMLVGWTENCYIMVQAIGLVLDSYDFEVKLKLFEIENS